MLSPGSHLGIWVFLKPPPTPGHFLNTPAQGHMTVRGLEASRHTLPSEFLVSAELTTGKG